MKAFAQMKHSLQNFSQGRRAIIVVAVFVAVAAAWTSERNMSTRFSFMKTRKSDALRVESARGQGPLLIDKGAMPELDGATGWLNSASLQPRSLRGKVVLVDFWTYTCINSLRPLPYLKSWGAKYKDAGFVVIGVHTPEFTFEKERKNVEDALRRLNVGFHVAIDSDYRI